jgi:predicted nucleotidyltransferase
MTTAALEASTVAVAPPISVTAEQWAILTDVLNRYAGGRPVWAYGSRARGTRVRPYSDLDLIVGGAPLDGEEAWKLEEALDESRLPFRVELQHESGLNADFRQRIEKDFVVVQ